MRKFNLNSSSSRGFFQKGLMAIAGLAVLTLVLVGAFYLAIAAIVIALSTSLLSRVRPRPQAVKVKSVRLPLDGEYRVIRRK